MANSRSAHHTINGYKYQFDKAIIALSQAREDESVAMECIEDIDLGTGELIQCKYHAEKTYYPSTIRAPLLYFLNHFASVTGVAPRYTLYAHFGEKSPTGALTYDEVVTVIGGQAIPIKDAQLRVFVADHFRFVPGPHIDVQEQQVIAAIRTRLNCSAEECDWCFYSNALAEVLRLSRQPTAKESSTTPREFFRRINKRQLLLDHWMSQLHAIDDYVKFCVKKLHDRSALRSSKRRVFVLSGPFIASVAVRDVASLIESVVSHSYRMKDALHTAVPPTFICDCEDSKVREIKVRLIEKGIPFNDGLEHLKFSVNNFEKPPITNRIQARGSSPSDTLLDASYHVRLLSKATFQSARSQLEIPHTVIDVATSSVETIPHFDEADNYLFTSIRDTDTLTKVLCSKVK